MIYGKRLGWISVACLAAVLGSMLALLYVRNQGHDSNSYLQSVAIVRQLQQLDERWELDVVNTQTGLNANYNSLADPLPQFNRLQAQLRTTVAAGPHGNGVELARADDAFGRAVLQKTRLIERFEIPQCHLAELPDLSSNGGKRSEDCLARRQSARLRGAGSACGQRRYDIAGHFGLRSDTI